ncbi:hypothetical protein IWX84_000376 [Flavobacterium sp. CG_9.10]|uniref:hypothetical protein n=1 Tax=Flavobacterium sp. CG_9.10 TaxID=2787729 RepID=UPI0018CBC9BB|nr:hypothetical protein [Flavobacterium sp. CG_9.10]MBG6109517.1 hypothetical protein [Flavobacterium sp. CG_9.10]
MRKLLVEIYFLTNVHKKRRSFEGPPIVDSDLPLSTLPFGIVYYLKNLLFADGIKSSDESKQHSKIQ